LQPAMGIFRAGVEPGNSAILLPEFNVVAVDKLLGRFDCRIVTGAIELDRIDEMAVAANDVDAITSHGAHRGIRRERAALTVTDNCLDWGGDA
jgi:hypothetical protein